VEGGLSFRRLICNYGRSILLGTMLAASSEFATGQLQPDSNTTVPGEFALRDHAIRSDPPSFPEDAIRARKTGVAVAVLEIDKAGHVSQVSVLEAPSPSIEESLVHTLMQWRFRPFLIGGVTPTRVRSKLTFYFVIQGAKAGVFGPKDAPYIELLEQLGINQSGKADEHTAGVGSSPSDSDWGEITGAQLRDLWKAGKVVPVIDIRLRSEYRVAHIADSVNIPIDELEYRAPHEVPRWPTVVLYCYYCPNCDAAAHPEGVNSSCAVAASDLKDAGYTTSDC
jgi:TonB family protein